MSINYHGVFKEIKDDKFLNVREVKFYEGLFVDFYIHLLSDTELETEIYINQGMTCGTKVFEIACGTGRIGIPLARAGFDVTGVDISGDMLECYRKNLSKEKTRIRKNVQLYQADITTFEIDEKYDLIIFPATTICLFSDAQIRSIFEFVEKHLKKNGKFVFDSHVINESYYHDFMSKPKTYIWDDEMGHHVAVYQEFLEADKTESVVNIFCTSINGQEETRNIGYTRKRVITEEMVQKYIEESNLKVYRNINELVSAGMKFYVLENK